MNSSLDSRGEGVEAEIEEGEKSWMVVTGEKRLTLRLFGEEEAGEEEEGEEILKVPVKRFFFLSSVSKKVEISLDQEVILESK